MEGSRCCCLLLPLLLLLLLLLMPRRNSFASRRRQHGHGWPFLPRLYLLAGCWLLSCLLGLLQLLVPKSGLMTLA